MLIFFLIQYEIKKLIEKTVRFLARAPVWIPAVIVALVILATLLLPYGIRRGLERWLFVGSFGIATDRLFLCDPVVDIDAEAKPRLELAI